MVGRLFRNRNRPRVTLDLKVGSSHVVEVLLHLRRADWEWYQSNEEAIEEEVLDLLEESVLSRMFGEEIEEYHRKNNPQIFPPDKTVGAKNKFGKNHQGNNNKRNPKGSRKGGKAAAAAAARKQVEVEEEEKKAKKDVYFAFGELLQLAYRKQDLPTWNQAGRTIFFNDGDGEGFHDRPKLPARLLIWCSKINPQNNTDPDPANVGFLRQEMIPISSLFREPKDIE
jgi:hypothetical protein